jgi:hypothetical protein
LAISARLPSGTLSALSSPPCFFRSAATSSFFHPCFVMPWPSQRRNTSRSITAGAGGRNTSTVCFAFLPFVADSAIVMRLGMCDIARMRMPPTSSLPKRTEESR